MLKNLRKAERRRKDLFIIDGLLIRLNPIFKIKLDIALTKYKNAQKENYDENRFLGGEKFTGIVNGERMDCYYDGRPDWIVIDFFCYNCRRLRLSVLCNEDGTPKKVINYQDCGCNPYMG